MFKFVQFSEKTDCNLFSTFSSIEITKFRTKRLIKRAYKPRHSARYNQSLFDKSKSKARRLLVTMGNQLCCAKNSDPDFLDYHKKKRKGDSRPEKGPRDFAESKSYREQHSSLLNASVYHPESMKMHESEYMDSIIGAVRALSVDGKDTVESKPTFANKSMENRPLETDLKDPSVEYQTSPIHPPSNPNNLLTEKATLESQLLLRSPEVQEILNVPSVIENIGDTNDKLAENFPEINFNEEKCQSPIQQAENEEAEKPTNDEKTDEVKDFENEEDKRLEGDGCVLPEASEKGEDSAASMAENCDVAEDKVEQILEEEEIAIPSTLPNDLQENDTCCGEIEIAASNMELIEEKKSEGEDNEAEVEEKTNNNEQLSYENEAQHLSGEEEDQAEEKQPLANLQEEQTDNINHNSAENRPLDEANPSVPDDNEDQSDLGKELDSLSSVPEMIVQETISKDNQHELTQLADDRAEKLPKTNELVFQPEEAKCNPHIEISEELSSPQADDKKESLTDSRISLDNDLIETHELTESTQMSQTHEKSCVSEIFDKAPEVSLVKSTRKSTISPSLIKSGQFSIDDTNFPPLDQLLQKPTLCLSLSKPRSRVLAISQTSLSNCSNTASTSQSQVLEEKVLPRRNRKFRKYPTVKH